MNDERDTFELRDVLTTKRLGRLGVGASTEEVSSAFGAPDRPAARLSRRSKIWVWEYGNVTLLVEDAHVASISIDFEKTYARPMVLSSEGWRLDDWLKFAEREQWDVTSGEDVIALQRGHSRLSLSSQRGSLHVASVNDQPQSD